MRRFLGFWVTLACMLAGQAQQIAQLDFFAHARRCEIDYDKDGCDDSWGLGAAPGIDRTSFRAALDYQLKYEGVASQRVEFSRMGGAAGWASLSTGLGNDSFLKPDPGEPILVRFAFRAEGFQNATYRVSVHTGGQWHTIVAASSQDTNGWREVSMVVPVGNYASAPPIFSLIVTFDLGPGAASGRFWIDDVRAISTRAVMRQGSLPNGLKLAIVNPQHNPYRDLSGLPIGFVIGSRGHISVFSAHYPNTLFAPYAYFSGTIVAPDARYNRDIYNYDDVNQNYPGWFLRNNAGERITRDNGATYEMDVGQEGVRRRALESLRDYMLRAGRPRYVFLDAVDMRIGSQSPAYNNNINLWAQAVADALSYIGSRLQNEVGTSIIPNVAWSPAFWLRGMNGGPDAPGASTLPYTGGFLIEHAFTHARVSQNRTTILNYGTARDLNNWQIWTLRDQIRLATEYPDKIVILLSTYVPNLADSRQRIRFAIAGWLIVQHDNTYVMLEPRHSGGVQYPEGFYPPEMFVPLGRWTENYRILNGDIISGGLFVRNYENGIVVWNPTHDRTFYFTLPRDMYDWDRNLRRAGEAVRIDPQTGHVFYSAPEITVELSPHNVQVLPGQTVQFTVTYRNRGTAPGINVRIAVPLPQGMTLVGSNPQARLENGQVVWTVPHIPVGGQGTLQFTVRVE
ncbi:MAG: putative glycoside hydrolase [Fimbriimonadales bacterium]|nr:putative glycoside hydrolase [Fimbriimonadales bacterium]MDW8052148.1 putative glycoside hydrolase [Armatimonadota bacterium]